MTRPPWTPTPPGCAFSLTERQARVWRPDGVVGAAHPLLGGSLAADVPLDPTHRARQLHPAVPAHAVVILAAAAWVHLGGMPPRRIDVARATPVRDRFRATRCHTLDYGPAEVLELAGLAVTTPVATAADLARFLSTSSTSAERHTTEPSETERGDALRALLATLVSPSAAIAHLRAQPARSHGLRAIRVLEELAREPAASRSIRELAGRRERGPHPGGLR